MSRRSALIGLLALSLCALGMRWTGLDALLPHAPEPDAYLVDQVRALRSGDEAAREEIPWGKYPHLLSRALALVPEHPAPSEPPSAANVDAHLAHASADYLRARALVALLAALLVPLTWLLARRCLSAGEALLPAALVGTSLLHLVFSQQARPHAALASFTTAALLAALWVLRSQARPLACVLAGLLGALALACLHNGVIVLPPLLLAWWIGARGRRGARAWVLVYTSVLLGFVLLAFYPFLFAGASESEVELASGELVQSGHRVRWSWFNGKGVLVLWHALADYDPVLTLLAALGLLVALGRLRTGGLRVTPELAVALALGLPYLLALALFQKSFERFVLPLHPLLAVLGAWGLFQLLPARRAGLRAGVALLVCALPLLVCLRRVQLVLRPDTYELAAEWVEAELPAGRAGLMLDPRVVLPLVGHVEDARLGPAGEGVEFMAWHEQLASSPPAPGAQRLAVIQTRSGLRGGQTRRGGAGQVSGSLERAIADSLRELDLPFAAARMASDPARTPPLSQVLAERAQVLVRISPSRDAAHPGAEEGYQGEHPLARLWRTTCLGPAIELWRMGR